MALLALPSELLHVVLSFACSSSGLSQPLQLRLVCRKFDSHLLTHIILDLRRFGQYAADPLDLAAINRPFMERILHESLRTLAPGKNMLIDTIREASKLLVTIHENDECLAIARKERYHQVLCELLLDMKTPLPEANSLLMRCQRSSSGKSSSCGSSELIPPAENALVAAAYDNDAVALSYLVEKGADISVWNGAFGDPLQCASRRGSTDAAEFLLQLPGRELRRCPEGLTPLHTAVQYGHESVVQLLLRQNDVYVNSRTIYGFTPLSLAAHEGQEGVVPLLLSRTDVALEANDASGKTPLHHAASKGREAVAKLLLGNGGIDIHARDHFNDTPLSNAALHGHAGVVGHILAQDDLDMNVRDTLLSKPLWKAAGGGHAAVVKILLEKGCNPNEDIGIHPPLTTAARHGHEQVVRMLLNYDGIAIDSADIDGQTPLQAASMNGHEGVVKMLLNREGVSLNAANSQGFTPLAWASRNGHERVVQILLDRDGVNINATDETSRSPLSWAAGNGHTAVVKELLNQEEVDVNSTDKTGKTALSWSMEKFSERTDVITLLLDAGACLNNASTPV